jgi:hypothetical protein
MGFQVGMNIMGCIESKYGAVSRARLDPEDRRFQT